MKKYEDHIYNFANNSIISLDSSKNYTLIEMIKMNPYCFEGLSDIYKNDKEFVLDVIEYEGCIIQFLRNDLRKDKEIILKAVKQNPFALQYVDKSLRCDRDIVKTAVSKDGITLRYADETLKNDRELLLISDRMFDIKKSRIEKLNNITFEFRYLKL